MNLEPRPHLTDSDVWTFICEGCNANEIAAYAGIKVFAAHALMQHATRTHAAAKEIPVGMAAGEIPTRQGAAQ